MLFQSTPPSIKIFEPVIKAESSEARNAIVFAMCSGLPYKPIGDDFIIFSSWALMASSGKLIACSALVFIPPTLKHHLKYEKY